MVHRWFRRAASIIILGMAVSVASSASSAQNTQVATQQNDSLDNLKLSITILPRGQEPTINVSKISADGVVVGSAPPQGNVLRWLASASAPDNLGGAPAFTLLNRLPLISADGATIVANRLVSVGNGMTIGVPSVWNRGTEWTALPRLTLRTSNSVGMSRDGTRLVGYGWNDSATEQARPWVWSAEQGQQVLPVASATRGGEAWASSDDGDVVVGHQFDFPNLPDPRRRFFATRWSEGKMLVLTDENNVQLGQAFSCSSDCSIVVGGGQGGDPNPGHPNFGQAWLWTEATRGVYLGSLPDAAPQTTSYATDVSGDGSVIIGTYYHLNDDESISYRGFLWSRVTGLVSILELMAKNGISHGSDWRTIVPTAITPAGDMILIGGLDANHTPGGFILHVDGLTSTIRNQ